VTCSCAGSAAPPGCNASQSLRRCADEPGPCLDTVFGARSSCDGDAGCPAAWRPPPDRATCSAAEQQQARGQRRYADQPDRTAAKDAGSPRDVAPRGCQWRPQRGSKPYLLAETCVPPYAERPPALAGCPHSQVGTSGGARRQRSASTRATAASAGTPWESLPASHAGRGSRHNGWTAECRPIKHARSAPAITATACPGRRHCKWSRRSLNRLA